MVNMVYVYVRMDYTPGDEGENCLDGIEIYKTLESAFRNNTFEETESYPFEYLDTKEKIWTQIDPTNRWYDRYGSVIIRREVLT